jgi:FkbM family methyltransferase
MEVGRSIWDVGAHAGYYTLLASLGVGHQGKVVAFEPFPENIACLRKHIAINNANNVRVVEAAVANSDGMISFKSGPTSTRGSIANDGELKVRSIRLDTLVERGNIPLPDLIKLDIEGAEFQALQGAQRTIETYHPLIFLATHGNEVRKQCLEFLQSSGYVLEAVSAAPFEDEDEFIARYRGRQNAES